MIRALCKNQTFMLTALDGSVMFTKPNDVNEIEEKFTTDPTYKMAVASGALEPFKTEKEAMQKANAKKPQTQNEEGKDDKKADDAK